MNKTLLIANRIGWGLLAVAFGSFVSLRHRELMSVVGPYLTLLGAIVVGVASPWKPAT